MGYKIYSFFETLKQFDFAYMVQRSQCEIQSCLVSAFQTLEWWSGTLLMTIIGIDWLNDILLTSIVTNDHHGHRLFVRKWTFNDIALVAATKQWLWEDQIHFLTSGSSGEPWSPSDSPENIASHANALHSLLQAHSECYRWLISTDISIVF